MTRPVLVSLQTNGTACSLIESIDLNDSEQYPADMTIKCGSLNVEAHSHVLCQDSSYFKIICKGGFLVHSQLCCVERALLLTHFQEEYTQELELPAEEEFLVRRLLCYCYTTGYNDEPYDDENDPPPHIEAPAYVNRLNLNAQMYSTADKYDIPSLKEKAAAKFDTAIREMMHANESMDLRTGASLVDEMIEAIPHIYDSTPDGDRRLRDRAVQVVLYKRREVQDHPGLQDLMEAVPEFFEERGIRSSRLASKLARAF